jgi:maltooligosyltrehalose trehalohydrolase
VLASPWTPLVFMGEEHGERRPFQFFTDHIDPRIAEATREGRRREHAHEVDPADVPDPQDPATLARSVLAPEDGDPEVREMFARALAARRDLPPGPASETRADEEARTLMVRRGESELHASFADAPCTITTATTAIVAQTGGVTLADGRLELPPMSGALTR